MTHTIYDQIKSYLEHHSYARERRFRNKALVEMLLEKHGDGSMFFPLSKLKDFVEDYVSYERVWRLVLEDCPELRGNDYKDKDIYEQKFEIERLGREVGYNQNVKKLASLPE